MPVLGEASSLIQVGENTAKSSFLIVERMPLCPMLLGCKIYWDLPPFKSCAEPPGFLVGVDKLKARGVSDCEACARIKVAFMRERYNKGRCGLHRYE